MVSLALPLACLTVVITYWWRRLTRKNPKAEAVIDGFYKDYEDFLELEELVPGRWLRVFRNLEKSNKVIFVFIHGACGWMGQYRYQIEHFLKNSETGVVAFDLFGCGKSYKPKGSGLYTNNMLVEDCNALLRSLPKDVPLILVGHSYGTSIAMELAKTRKKLVQGLILLGPADISDERVTPWIFSLPNWLLYIMQPSLDEAFRAKALHPETGNGIPEICTAASSRNPVHMFASFYRSFDGWSRDRISPLFKSFNHTALIILGLSDKILPRKMADKLASRFKSSEVVEVKEAGHLMMEEQPNFVTIQIETYALTVIARLKKKAVK